MLRGIPSLLYPDLLHALGSLGHGDILAVVDRNFPAASTAQDLPVKAPLQVTTDAIAALEAILTVFPIDTYNPELPAVLGMQVVDHPDAVPDIVRAAESLFEIQNSKVTLIERFAFYEAAQKSYAIVRTMEDRPYGNFLIRKGVV